MNIKIEIVGDSYALPENASVNEVIAARITEQKEVISALDIEKSKATEKLSMLEGIVKEATRTRS